MVNIDNGFGAAQAALRTANSLARMKQPCVIVVSSIIRYLFAYERVLHKSEIIYAHP